MVKALCPLPVNIITRKTVGWGEAYGCSMDILDPQVINEAGGFCELKASLLYKVSFRKARDT